MRALVCAVLLCLSTAAYADCAASAMDYWPPDGKVIAPSGLLYVEGYGMDQKGVAAITGGFLKSDAEQVPLVQVAKHTGALSLTQVVFRAARSLKTGATYTLWLTDGSKTWAPKYHGAPTIRWTVAEAPTPAWAGVPVATTRSFEPLGCGPSSHQEVSMPLTAHTGLLEVSVEGGKRTQRYILPVPTKGGLRIGHGMCSGAFKVWGEGALIARLALIGADGARIPAPGAVRFDAIAPE